MRKDRNSLFCAAALLQQIMMSFLTQEGGRVVITWGATEKDGLVATHKPPETQNKKKALIFMKSQQEVTPENFNDVVFCMESNVNTLEFLSSLASNVYFPVRTETWSYYVIICAMLCTELTRRYMISA